MTNLDKLLNPIDNLIKVLNSEVISCEMCIYKEHPTMCSIPNCKSGIKQWLESEVDTEIESQ